MRFRLAPSVAASATLVFLVTITTSAFLLFRQQQLAEQDPQFGRTLLWQAISYSPWIPFAWLLWRLFGKARLSRAIVARYLLLGLVAVPAHAFTATLVDISFSRPGGADLVALAAQRAQLDILIYSAFGLLAIAADFQRTAKDKAEISAALKQALAAARAGRPETSNVSAAELETLVVSVGQKRVPVEIGKVEWFGSAGNYVVVNWDGREGLIRQTLQAVEHRLDPHVFARSHRTIIVNLSRVASAQPLSDGSWRLTMTSGTELVASRTYRDEIMARLERTSVRPA